MLRGELRLVDFEPSRGSEADKRRPAIIVSNDAANRTATQLGRGVITVVPVTSNVRRIYSFQVFLPSDSTSLDRNSKAQTEQIRAVDVERVGERVGRIPGPLMRELEDALRLQLDL